MADLPAALDSDRATHSARAALKAGDVAQARVICRQVLDAQADHAGALFVLGLIEMQDRRPDAAIAVFERVTRLEPSVEAWLNLATARFHLGRLEPALQAANTALAIDPAHPGALLVLAGVLHGLERHADALRVALEAERLDPASDIACARVGSILERMGRPLEADAQFRKAEKLGGASKPYSLVSFARSTLHSLMAQRKDLVAPPVHRFGPRAPGSQHLVVMACCDGDYFSKYGVNFINSYAHNAAQDSLLHVHVVDPGADLDVMLDRLARRAPPADFLVTTEVSPFAGVTVGLAAHTFYSCCRFLQLPGLLAHYRRPIVCVDIDAIIEGPFQGLVAAAAAGDIGLTRRTPVHSPWLDVPAGLVIANPTAGAARYFELVRDYALHFMGRREFKWHLDQAALYCVLRLLEHHGGSAHNPLLARLLSSILPAMLAPPPAPPRVTWISQSVAIPVWQIGHSNDTRLEDVRFTHYSLGNEAAGH